jgi:dephospho-CoA kinase
VFKYPEKLQQLNGLVHPAVWKDIAAWFAEHKQFPYVAEESAILFEAGLNKALDRVILVYAPVELRIARTMARDNCSRHSVEERIRNQADPEKTRTLADFVVVNDGITPVIPQVLHIHEKLLNL